MIELPANTWVAQATISNEEIGYRKTWLLFWPGLKIRCPERIAGWLVERLP